MKGQFNIAQKIDSVGVTNCYISEITLAELKYGVEKSDRKEKNKLELQKIIDKFTIVPIFTALDIYAEEKARLKKIGNILDDFDLLIGATAIANNLIIATRNVSDFDRLVNISIDNWVQNS